MRSAVKSVPCWHQPYREQVMQHPSKPLAKTRQGTLAGSAEQGIHIW
ncbi:hypothetical protein GV706_06800, partial [Klebsiella pneumoniae]|nr:hypothetical protein [Klebsiella pneumoniae]HBW8822025.1 hypothetical protein [Klebsiella pneumoniae]